MKPTLLILALCCYLISSCQTIAVNANIINEDGAAVSGATVTIKGTNRKAVADQNGLFSIDHLQLKDTLIISAVGYVSETIIVSRIPRPASVFNIIIKRSVRSLSEVIINTGYQSLSPERTTGSFEQITADELQLRTAPGILDRLNGTVSSVSFPGKLDGPLLMVRGLSTISGPKSPLIVIDNFPYEGNIANIDPDDVESITVLKDAAAASIW